MTTGLSKDAELLRSCNKCGFCQEVCPTYRTTGRESDVARGRNRLIGLLAEGRLGPAEEADLRQHLFSCLVCGACASVCPSNVPTDRLVLGARAALAGTCGLPWLSRLALHRVLRRPEDLARALRPMRFYQASGLRRLARASGALRLAGVMGQVEGLLPPVPPRSLRAVLRRAKGREPATASGSRGTVAYFLGCLTDNLFPAVGQAVIGVLRRNGYIVVVPKNLCCGVAHQAYGDRLTAESLARRNVDLLAATGARLVVADCASCAGALTSYRELLSGDPEYASLAADVACRTRDVSQLLVEESFEAPAGVAGPGSAAASRQQVTYHDPCHLIRGLGVREQPRGLLGAVPGLEFVEMAEADWCCGGAGSFNVTHYGLSMGILDRKMKRFRETGAALLATSCPSCLLQLGHGLRRLGSPAIAVHPVELLWRAYQDSEV